MGLRVLHVVPDRLAEDAAALPTHMIVGSAIGVDTVALILRGPWEDPSPGGDLGEGGARSFRDLKTIDFISRVECGPECLKVTRALPE